MPRSGRSAREPARSRRPPGIARTRVGIGISNARRVIETGLYLGAAVANIVNALNPEMIVISGGMAKAGKPLLDKIKETVKERALKESRRGLKIVLGKLGEDAGIIGAVKFRGI